MILQGLVISDLADGYRSKNGSEVSTQVLTIVDQDRSGHRLKQTVDIQLVGEEKEKFAGRLIDKRIEVSVTEIQVFGGRIRIRGNIINVDGKPVNGEPSKPTAGKQSS